MKITPAPILLFAYNRLDHLKLTIDALSKNKLATVSDLYVFSDGAKENDIESKKAVQEIRGYLTTIRGFKTINIVCHDNNKGLAKNITEAVSNYIKIYKKVIVLEDDIITSENFLLYMNTALEKYKNHGRIWHVSGWNYPIVEKEDKSQHAFFWRGMNCWGWGTWEDRWIYFNKDPKRIITHWDKKKIYNFNIDGCHNFFSQIKLNSEGRINTWAIFWYATIFENDGLCLNPIVSLTENVGLDGSGTNCRKQSHKSLFSVSNKVSIYPEEFAEDKKILKKIQICLKENEPSLFKRIIDKLRREINK